MTTSSNEDNPVRGLIARIRSALGWATADRRAQARGELEELDADGAADAGGDGGAGPSEVLDQAELDVRADHGELAPQTEAKTDRPPRQAG